MERSSSRSRNWIPPPRWHDDAGLETVEYALIAAIMLGAVIAAFPTVPDGFTQAYSAISNALATAMGG